MKAVIARIGSDRALWWRYLAPSLGLLGKIGVSLIPICYLVDITAAPDSNYDTLAVRLLAGLIAIPLLFAKSTFSIWEKQWEAYAFWICCPLFPFLWGVMLFGNAATSLPDDPSDLMYWVVQYMIALYFLTQLSNSPYVATIHYFLGTSAAIAYVYATTDSINWVEVNRVFSWQLVAAYLTAVVLGSFTNRNPQMVRTESLFAARAVGHNIAHEMRTPLTGIISRSRASTALFSHIADGYEQARDNGLPIHQLTTRQLELVKSSFDDIAQEASYANSIIDMLLVNTSENPVFGQSIQTLSASSLVDQALQRYPFSNDRESNLVHQDTRSDFTASVPVVLIDHVIFNLVKNALYYVQNSGSTSITLIIESDPTDKSAGTITCLDDGPGIPAANLPRIFERFFTTTTVGRGSGIGLNFCKMVMEGIGGSIHCESVEGEYASFILTIPKRTAPEIDENSLRPKSNSTDL